MAFIPDEPASGFIPDSETPKGFVPDDIAPPVDGLPGTDEARAEYESATGEKVTNAEALGVGALASAMLDFDDEAKGAARAIKAKWFEAASPEAKQDFIDYYRFFRDQERAKKEAAFEAHPASYIAGEVAGGLPYLAIPGAGLAKEASVAKRLGSVALRAVPQAIGMGKADLTKGEIGEAVGEVGQNVAFATALHGVLEGGVALGKKALGKGVRGAKAAEGAALKPGTVDTDSYKHAEELLQAHEGAEIALVRSLVEPDFDPSVLSDVERLAVNKKGASRIDPEVLKMARELEGKTTQGPLTQARAAKAETAELVRGGETAAQRSALELDIVDPLTAKREQAALLARAAKSTNKNLDDYLGDLWMTDTQHRLTKDIGEDRLKNVIAQTETDTKPLLSLVTNFRMAQEFADDAGHMSKTLGRSDNAMKRILGKFMDGREYYLSLEKTHNIPFIDTIDSVSNKINRLNVLRTTIDKDLRPLDAAYRKAVKAGALDETTLARLSEGASLPDNLSPTQAALVDNFRGVMSYLRDEFNVSEQTGKAFYFPRIMRDGAYITKDLYAGVKAGEKLVGKGYTQWADSDMKTLLANKEFGEIFNGIAYLRGGEKGRPKNASDLQTAISELMDPTHMERSIQANARAVNERLAESMPIWLRETNPSSAIRKYVTTTGEYKMLVDDLAKLESFGQMLEARGDKLGANYVWNHLVDMRGGGREGTLASAVSAAERSFISAMDRRAVDAKSEVARTFYNNAREMPSIARATMRDMYPAYLGTRLDAPLRNVVGAAAQIYGETSDPRYFAKLVTTGTARLMKEGGAGMKRLERLGIIQPEHTAEYMDIVRRTQAKTAFGRGLDKYKDKANWAAMWLFKKSEDAARATSHYIGEGIASDLATGFGKKAADLTADEASAVKVAGRLLSEVDRRNVAKLLAAGELEGVKEIVSRRFVSKTQFNYNTANASAFAREVGPYMAMFTKWPTAIGADIVNTVKHDSATEAARQLMRKYMAPLALMSAVGQMLPGEDEIAFSEKYGAPVGEQVRGPDDVGQRMGRALLGRGAMAKYAPIDAPRATLNMLNPLSTTKNQGLGTVPLWDTSKRLIQTSLKDLDTRDKTLGLIKEAAPLVPAGAWIRFLLYDIPAIASGDPER